VSELRLKRRVATLELSEAREMESAREALTVREKMEEALVRAQEKVKLSETQFLAKEAELKNEISEVGL